MISAVMTLLFMAAYVFAVFGAGNVALTVSADRTIAGTGDTVVFTVTLTDGENAHIDGISFHVQVTDGLTIESAGVDCAPKFQMSSYNVKTGLFSAAAAKNGTGVDDDVWNVLTVTCTVGQTASGKESLFVSRTFNDVPDPKWSLYRLDESNEVHHLECDLTGASASVNVWGTDDRQTSVETEKPESEEHRKPTVPSPPSSGSGTVASGTTNERNDLPSGNEIKEPEEKPQTPSVEGTGFLPGFETTEPDGASRIENTPDVWDSESSTDADNKAVPRQEEKQGSGKYETPPEATVTDRKNTASVKERDMETEITPEERTEEGQSRRGALLAAGGTAAVLILIIVLARAVIKGIKNR